jgi:hypothetical protein
VVPFSIAGTGTLFTCQKHPRFQQVTDELKSGNTLTNDQPIDIFGAGLNPSASLTDSVLIAVQSYPVDLSNIDQIVDYYDQSSKQNYPDTYQVISRTGTIVSGKNAIMLEFKFDVTAPVNTHFLMLWVVSGKTLWTLTMRADDSVYSQSANDFNNIAKSFIIND